VNAFDFNRFAAISQARLMEAWAQFQSPLFLVQLTAILVTGLVALWVGPFLKRRLGAVAQKAGGHVLAVPAEMLASVARSGVWLLLLWIAAETGRSQSVPVVLIDDAVSLLAAWVVIKLLSHVVRNQLWSRVIFFTAWTLAALDILGILAEVELALDRLAVPYGNARISALNIVRAAIVLGVLLWFATLVQRFFERRIMLAHSLTPSLQGLIIQLLRLGLPTLAVLIALPLVGINLTTLTVFGGAFAVGAGLGLQRAVANLVSGLMLLSGGSIRPGDVIAVKDMAGAKTYGRVNSVGALFVSLHTRDGIDYLMPNDTFLSGGVENWSHIDQNIRLKVPFGASEDADPRQVITLALAAAAAVPRVLKSPPPVCFLVGFVEMGMQFELRFWITDPMNGTSNVRGACLLAVWEAFRANGIHTPSPQRDLHEASPHQHASPPPDG
jgi:small-conductance mechanosensitive channel